ncbi:MAG TPA: alpha/beta fold hydrolase [Marinagarivorans sp.]
MIDLMGLNFRVQGPLAEEETLKAGSPSAPVVLLHGLFGSMENLGVLARDLAPRAKVYSVDLPNHGRSPHTAAMSLSSLAQALLEWLDEQAIDRASFVGHSLGGKVAMELALMAPERCRKLAVIDIAPVRYEPHHAAVFEGLLAINPAALTSRSDADSQLKTYVPALPVRSFLLKNLQKTDAGYAWRMNLPVLRDTYPALIEANRQPSVPFDGEVLFVKGGDSSYILEEHRDAIQSRFPHAKLRIVAGTGHWLHAEKPEHLGRILNRFLTA